MKSTLNEARNLVNSYNQKYNTTFELGREYSLFPTSDDEYGFKDTWPSNEHGGVYLILDDNRNVIYVGQTKYFGQRFYTYFKDEDGTCVPVHNWSTTPKAIITIPAPDDAQYERLSLEEYLIQNLQPSDNTLGK